MAEWWKWLIQFNDFEKLWKAQPTYMLSQGVFLLAGIVTFTHAIKKGGRWPYFWIGTIIHGIYADNFWHFVLPEFDNFWHSQTPVMLLGSRMPLYILFVYPALIYHAAYAISKLNLPRFAEPFAVGLLTILIDLPYDITAVKFVHWTWHDTDPNIFDRNYWVPWTSYYFHATFAASYFYFFQVSRGWFKCMSNQWESAGKITELKSMFIASFLGMPGGVLMFVPLYHPIHDYFKVHTEVTVFLLLALFAVIVINGLLSVRRKETRLTTIDYVLLLQLAMYYVIFLVFVVFFNPENEVSEGYHEPVGPCSEMTTLTTPFGQTLPKRKYLCVDDYDEGYFTLSCLKQTLVPGTSWYTICGTPFQNRVEYITIVSTIIILASGVFYGLYFNTKPQKKQKLK